MTPSPALSSPQHGKTPSACARRVMKMALAARLERAMPGPSQEPPNQPNGGRPKLAKKKKEEARG